MPSYPTLLDIAKLNGSDALMGILEETVKATPEIEMGYARPIKGISFKAAVRTNLPRGGWRQANQGSPVSKSEWANKNFEAMIFNPRWECDKAVADRHEDGREVYVALEGDGIMRGAFITLAEQFYYGTSAEYGADGCPGLIDLYDPSRTVDAEGEGNATSSVWAIKWGVQDVGWLWGNGGQLALSELAEIQKTDEAGNSYTALMQEILSHVGIQVGRSFCAARIVNIQAPTSGDAGHPLTDDLMFKLLKTFPAGIRPDAFYMTRESLDQLRSSRTATNATGAPAPIPTEVANIPIYPTDAISDEEVAS